MVTYRDDGWPMCPRDGEDELWSPVMMRWGGFRQPRPTLADCFAEPFTCYLCGWSGLMPMQTAPPSAERCERCEAPIGGPASAWDRLCTYCWQRTYWSRHADPFRNPNVMRVHLVWAAYDWGTATTGPEGVPRRATV